GQVRTERAPCARNHVALLARAARLVDAAARLRIPTRFLRRSGARQAAHERDHPPGLRLRELGAGHLRPGDAPADRPEQLLVRSPHTVAAHGQVDAAPALSLRAVALRAVAEEVALPDRGVRRRVVRILRGAALEAHLAVLFRAVAAAPLDRTRHLIAVDL